MVEEDAYLLYPSKAFSSTGAPNGVHVKNSKALKQLFDVPLVVSKQKAAQAIFSLFYYQSNRSDGGGGGDNDGTERAAIIPEFDYLHTRRVDTRRREDGKNCDVSAAAAAAPPFGSMKSAMDTKISCHSDSDTASCVMHTVGLRGNTFLASMRNGGGASTMPFIVPSFRHRCCLDDIVSFSIRPIPHRPKCDRHETRRTILIGTPRFPQYGHTLHDFCMSLFAHVHPHQHTGHAGASRDHTVLPRSNILVLMANVETQTHQEAAVDFGVLAPLLQWAGVEYYRSVFDSTVCFDSITVGPSPSLNLYSPAIESEQGRRMLTHFVDFARQQVNVQAPPSTMKDKEKTKTGGVHVHIVLRSPTLSRQLLNADALLSSLRNSKTLGSLGATITVGEFAGMPLQTQIAQLAKTNVLVAVLGTALLNALFLPDDAAVVFLFPYGTKKHMGRNMRRAVLFTGKRALLEWHASDPHSSVYAAHFADAKGDPLEGAALTRAQRQFAMQTDVDVLWRERWLDAFDFFVNCKGVEVDVEAVVTQVEQGALQSAVRV